ncbi:MAG TPA: YdcF family protein [Blastocatellia bacterium]|nr:YdcF family protein [Blastocatellia bacterium]
MPDTSRQIFAMNAQHIDQLAQRIWDYHHLHHKLEPSDLILALGSNDIRVAEYAADLYLQGFAPRLMFSGNVGALTKDQFTKPEAEAFADIARQKGVPDEVMLLEPESTNTGENIRFSQRILAARGIDPARIILVQKPYMERRAFATFRQRWPEKDVIVTSPPIPFAEYCNELLPRDKVINIMVGDLQRIKFYPGLGFQIAQEIPADVWQAYETLVALGYDKHLMKE